MKLVRDKIPEIIRQKGEEATTHIADEVEYWQRLREKLLEEFLEFQKAETPEEFADMLEVIYAMAKYKNFDLGMIEEIRKNKVEERGGFDERIILHEP